MECPECKAEMVKRSGQHGDFYGCTNYKSTGCRGTRLADGSLPATKGGGGSGSGGGGGKKWDDRVMLEPKDIAECLRLAVSIVSRVMKDVPDMTSAEISAKQTSVFIALFEQMKFGKLHVN